MKIGTSIMLFASFAWWNLWFTPDQQGARLMRQERFADAATIFEDPMRQGVAWFHAGEFEKAEQAFARLATPDAEFNRGNCLVMRGKYTAAVERYDRALELRPDWKDAELNREIAATRAERIAQTGGDMGDQKLGADEIVFDKQKKSGGQETDVEGNQPLSDTEMQALWLRRVQTSPADFLKAKFAFQMADSTTESAQ